MFQKQKTGSSKLFKGSAVALAAAFSLTMFPVGLSSTSADYVNETIGSEAIIVQNINQSAPTTGAYEIRAAYFGDKAKIPVGLKEEQEGTNPYAANYYSISYGGSEITDITSSVSVTYANSNVPLEITKNSNAEIISDLQDPSKASEAVYGTVELSSAGEYIVEYTIDITLEGGKTKHFSTEYSVFSRISDAYFDFAENDPNVIPSVYDIDLVKAKNDGNLKNLALPLPTVFDENDVEQDVAFLSTNDQAAANGKAYVVISVSGGNNSPIAVEESEGSFFIPARYFDSQNADTFAGTGNFTIRYSYFTANGQFVTSISRSYRVEQTYYKNYSYDLSLTSSQVNAITGVEVELPTLSAATGEDADPSGESVEISYTVTAYRRDANGAYTETRDGSIVDGMFTPWADGDYLIRYDAVDFYGERKPYNDLYIEGVRDSRAPVVIAYDAGDDANFNDDGSVKEYIDASTKLKSKTRTNNIVIYAVGATDNVSTADEMELTRTVSSSSKTITIGNQYAKYNILFDFSVENLADNHTLLNLLTTAGVVTSDEAAVKTWLNANGYLIATNDESLTIEDGYAYLDVSLTNGYMLNGSQSGITYTVRYRATDAAGNNATSLSYQVNVTSDPSFADAEAPSITFPTSLKNSYRTDAVITFEEPTATDDNDTRMQLVVDYFYTGAEGQYDPITLDDEYSIDLAEIFGPDYSQDNRPVSVTIRVTTEDDYGNDATWTKEIEIADIEDSKVPVLVSEQYSKNPETIQQNSEVILPTLTFTDDNVRYMNAQVYVNRITYTTDSTSDENQVRVESPVVVTGKQEIQKSNGIYRVFAGKFVAAYGGDYEAKVVVTDAGGNQITTYYYFHAEGTTYVSDPVIQAPNVIGDEGTIELGTEIEFETPTISYSLAENQGILGVVTDDDSRSATDYFISVINGAPTDYTLDGDVFTARAVGNFTFVYNVKVTVFDNTIFSENAGKLVYNSSNAANDGSVSQLENQDLVILTDSALFYAPFTETNTDMQLYQISGKAGITVSNGVASASDDDGKTYAALITRTGIEFIARDGSTLDFSIADDKINLGSTSVSLDAAAATISSTAIKTYNLVSDPIRATVQDTTAPTMGEYDYPVTANVNETIAIQPPITAKDPGGIDWSRSYVQIAYRGSSSRTTTINMSDWTTNDDYNAETGNIDYQLTRDGNYTITYYVYDNQGNLNDDRSYSIAVGDCESPKIDLPSDLVEERYDLGSTLTLDFDKIKQAISDNVTSTDALLETLEIKLVNTSNNNKEVENTGNAEENRYSYTLNEAGTYRLEISVRDEAGWETVNDEIEFEVSTDAEGGMNVYEIVGTVLIVVACLVLAGVILYFVISKVKKDKKRKAKGSDTKKSADAKKKDK